MPKIKSSSKRSAPAPAPTRIISEIELADMLDVTDRRVRQLAVEGVAIKSGPASYDLGATLRALTRSNARKSTRRVTVSAVAAALAEALAGAREEREVNPHRDSLDVLEGDMLSLLLHC
jgi:hypothetical protein